MQQLQELLQKEMTRREFLATLGFGLAAVMGFSGLIKLLSGRSLGKSSDHGYGSSLYGR